MRGIHRLSAQILGPLLLLILVVQVSGAGTKLQCLCSLNDMQNSQVVVSCSKNKGEAAAVSCSKDVVPRISKGYRYVPGYGLFKHFIWGKTWQNAKKACELEGGSLYVPKDSQLTAILSNIFGRPEAFVGISDLTSEGIYVGVDNKVYLNLKWAPNEPNGMRKENCLTIIYDGLLNDDDCSRRRAFMCQRHLGALPPEGYVFADGFGFYKVYGEKQSFVDAQNTCERDGANLAVPETFGEAEALITVLKDDPQKLDELWIGLNDTVQEGRFTTASGRPLSEMEFDNWRPDEPNNHNGENCVLFYVAGYVNDDTCDRKFPFICEISLSGR